MLQQFLWLQNYVESLLILLYQKMLQYVRLRTSSAMVVRSFGVIQLFSLERALHQSGQGTVSLEFLEQIPEIDTIVVPISGGGLISGVTLAAKSINPAIRVFAAEPKGADDAARSKVAGRIIMLPKTNTIADGLRAFLGDLTWPVVRDLVEDIITVDDTEIVEAVKLCFEVLKVVVEPSGAVGLAAVLSDQFKQKRSWNEMKSIGIILSGGNVDLSVLWESLRSRSFVAAAV